MAHVLMILRESRSRNTLPLLSNFFMGAWIRLSKWRAHITFPATGGRLRGMGGWCLCFSYLGTMYGEFHSKPAASTRPMATYRSCTVSKSRPYEWKMRVNLLSRSVFKFSR